VAEGEDKVLGKGLNALIPASAGGAGDAEELRRVLKKLDELLGKLPEDVVKEFSASEDFAVYERVLKKYGVE